MPEYSFDDYLRESGVLPKPTAALPAVPSFGGWLSEKEKQDEENRLLMERAGPLERIFRRGGSGLGRVVQSVGTAVEQVTPFEQTGASIAQAGAQAVLPSRKVEDVNWLNPLDIASFVSESLAEQVPNMGAMLAGGAVAGPVGAGAASYVLNASETYLDLRERGVPEDEARVSAGFTGAGKALLDVVTPVRLLNKIRFVPKSAASTAQSTFSRLGKEFLKSGAIEGVTEGAQEALDLATEVYKDVPDTAEAAFSRVLNSMVTGGLTGGVFGAGAKGISPSPVETPPPVSGVAPTPAPSIPGQPMPTGAPAPLPSPTGPMPVPTPVTGTVPTDPLLSARQSVITAAGGPVGLFMAYTDEGIRKALKLPYDAPISTLVDAGVLMRRADDGLYEFSDKVRGKPTDYISNIGGRWWSDPVRGQVYMDFDQTDGSYTEFLTQKEDADGKTKYYWDDPQNPGSTQEFTDLTAAQSAIEILHPKTVNGWTQKGSTWYFNLEPGGKYDARVVVDPQTGLPSDVFHKDGYVISDTALIVGSLKSKQGSATTANTLAATQMEAEAFLKEQGTLSPFGQGVQWYRDIGMAGEQPRKILQDRPMFSASQPNLTTMAGNRASIVKDFRSGNTAIIDTDGGQTLGRIPVDEIHTGDFSGNTFVHDFVDRLSAVWNTAIRPQLAKSGNNQTRLLTEAIKGFGIISRKNLLGQYNPTSKDLSTAELAMNPFPWEIGDKGQTAEAFTGKLWGTFVHELTHGLIWYHDSLGLRGTSQAGNYTGPKFDELMLQMLLELEPARDAFLTTMGELYVGQQPFGTGHKFSTGVFNAFQQITQRAAAAKPAPVSGTSARGRAAGGGRTKRGPAGGAASVVGEGGESLDVGRGTEYAGSREESGSEAGGVDSAIEEREDFGPASEKYTELFLNQHQPASNPFTQRAWAKPEPFDPVTDQHVQGLSKLMETSPVGDFPKEVREDNIRDVTRFFYLTRRAMTLIQLAKKFPTHLPLQFYLNGVRKFWGTKSELTALGDKTLRDWTKLGRTRANKVARMMMEVTQESWKQKRKLTPQELANKAQKLGLDDVSFEAFMNNMASMEVVLAKMKQAQKDEATRLFGQLAPLVHGQIDAEYAVLEARNYAPLDRFGRYAVQVKATADMTWDGESYKTGQIVQFFTFEPDGILGVFGQGKQNTMTKELEQKFAGQPVSVTPRYIKDHERAFFSLPPSLVDMLADKLNLNAGQMQELKELAHKLAPGQGWVKHMIARKGIAGFSGDMQRAYADYMQHASNHVARLVHRAELEGALSAASREGARLGVQADLLSETMNKHYADLMDPGNDHGAIRGFVFTWFFGFSLRQAVVNTTQMPLFVYPYLVKKLGGNIVTGDWKVAAALGRAMINVSKMFTPVEAIKGGRGFVRPTGLNPIIVAQIQRGVKEGFLDQSLATELASAAQGWYGISKIPGVKEARLDYTLRRFMELSTLHFKLSEEGMRLTTFIASMELFMEQGMNVDKAYAESRDVIETSLFEYGRWNRPEIMRGGWKPVVFLFKMYLQHALHFTITGQGGARFWMMLLGMAGLSGIPFADDALNLVSGLSTFLKQWLGISNPKVDLEKDIRELVRDFGMNPDTVMNGLARRSFGLTGIAHAAGLPFPSIDFSPSVQFGRIIPGMNPMIEAAQGTQDWSKAMLDAMGETFGVAASTAMNYSRYAFEAKPGSDALKNRALPRVVRDYMRAKDLIQRENLVNDKGEELDSFDPNNPVHQGDHMRIILSTLFGQETQTSQKFEKYAAQREFREYYLTRREIMLTDWVKAIGGEDKEEIAAARRAFIKFNQTMPAQMRLTAGDLAESVRRRVKNQKLKAMGLPTTRKYVQMFEDIEKAYGEEAED